MAKEPVSSEYMSIKARRDYWQAVYESAVAAGDAEAAACALRYVVEHDTLIALIKARKRD